MAHPVGSGPPGLPTLVRENAVIRHTSEPDSGIEEDLAALAAAEERARPLGEYHADCERTVSLLIQRFVASNCDPGAHHDGEPMSSDELLRSVMRAANAYAMRYGLFASTFSRSARTLTRGEERSRTETPER